MIIPKSISFLISDYLFGWTKCERCGGLNPHDYYLANGRVTDNCWFCRKKTKGSIRVRWLKHVARRVRWGYMFNTYDFNKTHIFHGHVEWPYYANVFACNVGQCPVKEFENAIEEFRFRIGIPEKEYRRHLLAVKVGSDQRDLYTYL